MLYHLRMEGHSLLTDYFRTGRALAPGTRGAEGMRSGAIRSDLDAMILANATWSNAHAVTSLAVSGLLFQTAPGHAEELLAAVLDKVSRWPRAAGVHSCAPARVVVVAWRPCGAIDRVMG